MEGKISGEEHKVEDPSDNFLKVPVGFDEPAAKYNLGYNPNNVSWTRTATETYA